MTPVQIAMCKVIKENGGFPIVDCVKSSRELRKSLLRCGSEVSFNHRTFNRRGMWCFGCTIASVSIDGITVTSKEYAEWEKQKD